MTSQVQGRAVGGAVLVVAALGCGGFGASNPETDPYREALRVTPPRPPPGGIQPGFNSPIEPVDASLRPEECERVEPQPPPDDGCITAPLKCGDTLVGHTAGGFPNRFDTPFYEHNYCTPATTHHNMFSERLYRLEVPDGDYRAIVTLDTPCADLDLAAVKSRSDDCLSALSGVTQCEMSVRDDERDRLELASRHATTWWIIVDPKDGREASDAPFGLTVQCVPGLVGAPR